MAKFSFVAKQAAMATICVAICHGAMANSTAHSITDGTQLKLTQLKPAFDLSDAQINEIADSVAWRRLLLFPDRLDKAGSRIDHPNFFLAKNGHNDARAELIATINTLAEMDNDAICRFPARMHFLAIRLKKLGIDAPLDLQKCQEFQAFADSLDAKRLSLIFAEEHPNALASAFAHVLLRADDGHDDDARAMVINYTVVPDANDGTLTATVKSIAGRYAGVMEILPFAKKQADYLQKDERDLWQYALNLSEDEVAQIVRHIWEVKDMARPYFFTHDNCATEIVRLIDVVRPQMALQKRVGNIVIPARIAAILDEQGVVSSTKFIPSVSTIRQAYLNNVDEFDISTITPSRNNPADATPVHRIGIGVGLDDKWAKKATYGISFNGAYQDLLDNPMGVRPLLDLQLLSVDAIVNDEKVKLKDLTIFSTRSLNPANTAKNNATDPKGVGKAWGQRLRFTQVTDASDTSNQDHLVLDVGMQKGKSWNMGQTHAGSGEIADTTCYALIDGGVQVGRVNQGYRIGAGPVAGCVHYATDHLRGMIEVAAPYYYHHDSANGVRSGYFQPSLSVGVQADIGRTHAVRAVTKTERNHHDTNTQAMVSLLTYF